MYVHELTDAECREVLSGSQVGRLACSNEQQPYIVPINFAFDGVFIYFFTTLGQKVDWMRANPRVCFEVEELSSRNKWTSIVIYGHYEELADKPAFEMERVQAYECLSKRIMWWEPAYIGQEHRDQQHSLIPIFFRIRINKMTGHRATAEPEGEGDMLSLLGT
jgi:nitroimidazol reductase NimA-like FMN-containing flavoprotein (pyridoxamine 5'-phosphate oxidase superfamily)